MGKIFSLYRKQDPRFKSVLLFLHDKKNKLDSIDDPKHRTVVAKILDYLTDHVPNPQQTFTSTSPSGSNPIKERLVAIDHSDEEKFNPIWADIKYHIESIQAMIAEKMHKPYFPSTVECYYRNVSEPRGQNSRWVQNLLEQPNQNSAGWIMLPSVIDLREKDAFMRPETVRNVVIRPHIGSFATLRKTNFGSRKGDKITLYKQLLKI